MGSVLKDLGLYTLSLPIEFIVFIVSFLAQRHLCIVNKWI